MTGNQHRKRSGNTKPLEQWMAKRPTILASMLVGLASDCDDMADHMKQLRRRHGLGEKYPPLPEPEVWLPFYDKFRSEKDMVNAVQVIQDDETRALGRLQETLGRFVKSGTAEPDAIRKQVEAMIQEVGEEKALELFRQMQADAQALHDAGVGKAIDADLGEPLIKQDKQAFASPEFQFFMRVCVPCWIEYRMFPAELMAGARAGDEEALDMILRLDKVALYEPRIREHFLAAAYGAEPLLFAVLTRAIEQRPRGPMSSQKVKVGVGSLIQLIAEAAGERLTAPDVQRLFDAIAKAKGKVRDKDIPTRTPKTWATALARERPKWPKANKSDKSA